MDKREATMILQDAILDSMVLSWPDCAKLDAGIRRGLDEIERRRQEDGPAVMEMKRPRCGNTRGQKK